MAPTSKHYEGSFGRSPSGSGSRPTDRASDAVSPPDGASIPNAMRAIAAGLNEHAKLFLPNTREANTFSEAGVARKVVVALVLALESAAQGIEAQRAATGNTDAVADESPVAESDAPKGDQHD